MSDSESIPIFVTKEQAKLIRILPKNCRDWKSIWERHLLRMNLDLTTIERLINGEKYEVKGCKQCMEQSKK